MCIQGKRSRRRKIATARPPQCHFAATVVLEGPKAKGDDRNRRISIPAEVVRTLRAGGAKFPGWLRLHVNDCPPAIVQARFTSSRAVVDVTVPSWMGRFYSGERLRVIVEDAEPWRARRAHDRRDSFDWAPLSVDPGHFAEGEGWHLTVWHRREPFTLSRFALTETVFWLLGFYQAEGWKKNAKEWRVVSATPALLHAVANALEELGVTRAHCYLEVLHAVGDAPDEARKAFDFGVPITTVRARTPHKKWKSSGGRGAVLHVARSTPFLRMTLEALRKIFEKDGTFPSRAAARAYALGWLDGDAGIGGRKVITLGHYGTKKEVQVVQHALCYGFDWASKGGAHVRYMRHVSLTIRQAGELACAGGFAFSMNRARLLYALERNSAKARLLLQLSATFTHQEAVTAGVRGAQALVQSGILTRKNGRYALTRDARRACVLYEQLQPELVLLRQLSPVEHAGRTYQKCSPYPPALLPMSLQARHG